MISKYAVITGGTKGIGKELVREFANRGFNIATCSRNLDELKSLKYSIEEKFKVEVIAERVDVANKEEIEEFCKKLKSRNISVDVLVNNAGIFIPGQLLNEDDGIFEKVLKTNLFSAYYFTRGLIDVLRKSMSSHIFNICSTASIMAYPNGGSYSVSKYGLLGFSKGIREELKEEGIKVTSVIPGATFTSSWEGSDLPESRFMRASDIARAISECHQLSPQTVIEELLLRPMLGDI